MIRYLLVVAILVLTGCRGGQASIVETTVNLCSGDRAQLHSDAVMLLAVSDELHRDKYLASPTTVQRWETVSERFRQRVKDNGLSGYRRFIIAEDAESRILVTYPELDVKRELK